MASVNFPANVGGDGSTVSDDSSPTTGLENYGWRTRLVPALSQIVAIATWVKNRALDVAGYANTSQQAASTATSALNAITALGVNPAGYAALSGADFTGAGSFTSTVNVVTVNTTSGSGAVGLIQGQRSGVTKGYVGIDTSDNFGLFDNTGTMRAGVSSTGLAVTGTLAATGAATFGVAGVTSGVLNSADGFYINLDSDNDGTGSLFVISANRTSPTGGAGSLFTVSEAGAATIANGLAVTGDVLPEANGTRALGSTSLRWSQVWCTAGAFNTSDATLKTPIRTMQAKELAAGYQMAQELGTFQWIESVKEKGDKARRHVGLTVQRAAEIMEAHGLDPWSYGFMGYDKWDAVTEIVDATEDDDGAYQEQVTRQKIEKQTSQQQAIGIVNGKPVLKVETVESDVPVTEQIQVVDADGKPVFIDVPEVPAVLDEEGNVVTPAVHAHQVPMMHAVPVMETVTSWKRVKEVRPAGESYAFRSDQMSFFIAAGVAAKVAA